MSETVTRNPKSNRSFSLRALLLLVTLAALGLFGKQRWDVYQNRKILTQWIDQVRQFQVMSPNRNAANPLVCPVDLEKEEQLSLLLYGAVNLEEDFERTCCLKILAEHFPADAKEPLIRIAVRSKNPATQATAIRLLALIRDENILPRLMPVLDDPQSTETVKEAVLECIGFTHMPCYRLPWEGQSVLDTTPPIAVADLFFLPNSEKPDSTALPFGSVFPIQPITAEPKPDSDFSEIYLDRNKNEYLGVYENENVSLDYRELLMKQLLNSRSIETRNAAARGLLSWPTQDYQLRVAEWGVWLNDDGKMALAKSSIESIPDFVHSTGIELTEPEDRREIFIDKPVLHISTDRPMVLDIKVRINQGRPLFAFPIPDHFSILAGDGEEKRQLRKMHPKNAQPLADMHKGYPWLLSPVFNASKPQSVLANGKFLEAGLRWQNLILTPKKLDSLQLPTVSDDSKYDWWKRLRQVDSSFIANRNDTEKFLYYDGPTLARSPLKFQFSAEDTLEVTHQPLFKNIYAFNVDKRNDIPPRRTAFFVRVTADSVTGHRLVVNEKRDAAKQETLSLLNSDVLVADQLRSAIKQQILAAGLNESEASGMIDCWAEQWFETPGQRVLYLLTREEYDKLCPLLVRPRPTDLQRVGLVFTELGSNDEVKVESDD